jgi:hypothetical protein
LYWTVALPASWFPHFQVATACTSATPMAGPVSVSVTITLNASDPAAGDLAIKQLCIQVLPGWASLKPEELTVSSPSRCTCMQESKLTKFGMPSQITKISGGISNILVKVSPPAHASSPQEASAPLKPVAVKVWISG